MNKKLLLLIIVLIALTAVGVVTLLLLSKTEELPEIKIEELQEIKIAVNVELPFIFFVAEEKGFFEEEDLSVQFIQMPLEEHITALLSGQIDYFHSRIGVHSIEDSLKGSPIKIIMFTSKQVAFYLFSHTELEMNNLKTVGVLPSVLTYYQALRLIDENELEAKIITAKTPSELEFFLHSGTVDAALVAGSHIVKFYVQGFPLLTITPDTGIPSFIVAREDKIQKKQEEAQKLVRALERTMDFIITKPEETKEFSLKYLELEKTEQAIKIIEEFYPIMKNNYDKKNTPNDEEIKTLIRIAKAGKFETLEEINKQTVTAEDLEKVFDFLFIK